MKTLKNLFLISCTLTIIACKKPTNIITGVYVTAFRNEFNITNDTLIIEVYNAAGSTYQVLRHSGYHRIREGKILPKEFDVESWIASFDQEKQVLQETAFGRQIYIDPNGQLRAFGSTYRKIK